MSLSSPNPWGLHMAAGPCANLAPCAGVTAWPRQKSGRRSAKGVRKPGKTPHPRLLFQHCFPLNSTSPPLEPHTLHLFINLTEPSSAAQAQHHSPSASGSPFADPAVPAQKRNYHQARLANPCSRGGGCWALITPAEAFPAVARGHACTLAASDANSRFLGSLWLA